MGKETTQPTPIDKDEYKAFKNWVRDVHGKTRGHLGSEIENALREYRKNDSAPDRLRRMENDIATIKANIADAESDGGTVAPTPSEASDTRARRITKPAANQPRQKKVEYLVQEYCEEYDCDNDGGAVIENYAMSIVQDEYSFDDSIQDEYVTEILAELRDMYDPEPHPVHGKFEVWGEQLQRARETAEEIAQEQMDEVDV